MSRFAQTQHRLPHPTSSTSCPSYHQCTGMEELRKPPSKLTSLLHHAGHQRLAAAGCLVLALFLLCALFAPWLAPHNPAQLNLSARLLPPSAAHWFGTDELGRDVLSRTIYGARVSLLVAVAVVGISLTLGSILGMLAGFYGGFTDTVVNIYLTNAFLSLPGILLAVAIVAFLGPSLANLILALALAGWVNYARLVRAQVLTVKQREYVQAARSMGASDLHLMLRHILPNILQPLLVQAAIGMAAAVLSEATLSFLGLGVQPPTATWGAMLNDARSHMFESPYLMFFPAIALALCVFSFNLIGDGLRDYLDPRTRLRQGL
jgi:peptide/nickel transport system permease protein